MGDISRRPDEDTNVLEKQKHETKQPEMYKVVLLNDDYTPREFVVEILIRIFRKSASDAQVIMMRAHRGGKSVVGIYTYDIATTKVSQVRQKARASGYPLKMVVEGA